MLRVIVLLEDEPPSRSQITGRLTWVLPKSILVFSTIHLHHDLDQFPSHCAAEKHQHRMMWPPPCFSHLLAWSVSFGGQPSLGRFVMVSCAFHLNMIDLMVLLGHIKDLDLFV
ncbi:hypothetical protein AMECASPLE_035381 [Ameca splendens]|uniref:Uncharacterized protein n=1 Tax=Ameca splendens TaxID=208324 RepID=A0ABV1AGC8_9TELE